MVTVHDIFALTGAEYSTAAFQARFSEMLADAVARADRVICVSAWTRDRLCERLNVRYTITNQ